MAVEYAVVDPDLRDVRTEIHRARLRLEAARELMPEGSPSGEGYADLAESVLLEVGDCLKSIEHELKQATAWPPVGLKPVVSERLRRHCFAGAADEEDTRERMRFFATAAVEAALDAGLTHRAAQRRCLRSSDVAQKAARPAGQGRTGSSEGNPSVATVQRSKPAGRRQTAAAGRSRRGK